MKAFPNPMTLDRSGRTVENQVGMDLRDYFAAQIIPSLIINKTLHNTLLGMANNMDQPEENVIAGFAYTLADAMMEVRNVKQSS